MSPDVVIRGENNLCWAIIYVKYIKTVHLNGMGMYYGVLIEPTCVDISVPAIYIYVILIILGLSDAYMVSRLRLIGSVFMACRQNHYPNQDWRVRNPLQWSLNANRTIFIYKNAYGRFSVQLRLFSLDW